MKRTPFYQFHVDHGAKFVDFAGWEMPIMYTSIREEHRQVRESGGLFDVSHMGRLYISGRHARKFVERMVTRRITDMKEKTCRYSLICNEQGGTMDDILVYRFSDHWLLVVNASNRQKIVDHLKKHVGDLVVKIDDQTESTAMVAVQGPKVMETIGKFSSEVPTLKRYSFTTKNLMVVKLIISRTGYTGEDGVEVMLGASTANFAMKLLMKGGDEGPLLKPVGLGARDTLRIEAGMPLYGHELDEDIDPYTAGLGFGVSLDKHEPELGERFIGQDVLERIKREGTARKRVGLRLEGKRTPRQGMDVLKGDAKIGSVTSGCLSPTLNYPIAMAFVQSDSCDIGDTLNVKLSDSALSVAEVVPLPFYKK